MNEEHLVILHFHIEPTAIGYITADCLQYLNERCRYRFSHIKQMPSISTKIDEADDKQQGSVYS